MVKFEYFPEVLIKRIGSDVTEWISPAAILKRSRYFDSLSAASNCISDFVYFYKQFKNTKYKDFDCDIIDARVSQRIVEYHDWFFTGYKYDQNK